MKTDMYYFEVFSSIDSIGKFYFPWKAIQYAKYKSEIESKELEDSDAYMWYRVNLNIFGRMVGYYLLTQNNEKGYEFVWIGFMGIWWHLIDKKLIALKILVYLLIGIYLFQIF